MREKITYKIIQIVILLLFTQGKIEAQNNYNDTQDSVYRLGLINKQGMYSKKGIRAEVSVVMKDTLNNTYKVTIYGLNQAYVFYSMSDTLGNFYVDSVNIASLVMVRENRAGPYIIGTSIAGIGMGITYFNLIFYNKTLNNSNSNLFKQLLNVLVFTFVSTLSITTFIVGLNVLTQPKITNFGNYHITAIPIPESKIINKFKINSYLTKYNKAVFQKRKNDKRSKN